MNMKINLNKKQKIIVGTIVGLVAVIGITGYKIVSKNIKENKKLESTVDLYPVPGKEKIFMSGKVLPIKSEKLFVGPDQGELNEIKVDNGVYVEKGTTIFTCKNTSQINEISDLNSQISSKKKEKSNALDEESKIIIDSEIKELNNQISKLNKTAYQAVYAPFSGRVYINNEASKNDNSSYIAVIESEDFYVKGQVNEKDSYKIKLNEDVEVTAFATKEKYKGYISYLSERPLDSEELSQDVGSNSGMSQYGLKINLNTQQNLKNGLNVQILALYGGEDKKIPNTAIEKEGSKSFVYKVTGNVAYKTEVKVIEEKEEFVYVSRGVKEGDTIVKDIKTKPIKDGQEVNIGKDK